jgi:perosamine synthetase
MTTQLDTQALISLLKEALPASEGPIALHEPLFKGNEWEYVKKCLDTGWVSSVGAYVNQFEEMLSKYTGVNHAIAVVNGTAALHMCLHLVGVARNDEVIIPSLTFVATANAISYCGAIPLFCDSEERTLGIDAEKLNDFLLENAEIRGNACFNRNTGRRIAAIMPMHTFGHPVNIDALLLVSDKWNLPLVEDAAESLGSFYKGRHTGGFGKISGLSFNGNKIITTGGGGAILTNDPELARKAKHLTTTARVPHQWSFMHDEIGYNYRLPNINAALGCAQMESLPEYVAKKRALAQRYKTVLAGFKGVCFFREPADTQSNYWLNTILLDAPDITQRDDLLEKLNEAGLMTRPAWTLLHKLPIFSDCPRMDLSVAESLERRILNIPSSVRLG